MKALEYGSQALVSAYDRASCFALVSELETQPISALEAVARKKPILLGDRPYARQKYFSRACLVSDLIESGVSKGLELLLENPEEFICDQDLILECKEETVAGEYERVYGSLDVVRSLS